MQNPIDNSISSPVSLMIKVIIMIFTLIVGTTDTNASSAIDSFNDAVNNDRGLPRQHLNDSMSGGKTTSEHEVANGIIHLSGEIEPPRGQPGWASTVLLLTPDGLPVDASGFEGVRIKVKINQGIVSLSANSTEVTNFDYHAALVAAPADGDFHEISIPFDSMKRAWSEQTELNKQSINSLSIVAFSMQKAAYDFEIDEIVFY